MADFLDTDAGQVLAGSYKYLTAADILARSPIYKDRPSLLRAPILHSIAHGAELLLKFPLLALGRTTKEVRAEFGHNLVGLWNAPENDAVRSLVLESAEAGWAAAANSGDWPDDDFDRDPRAAFEEAFAVLADLHGVDFALRYIAAPNTLAPTPRALIDGLLPIAESGLKAPDTLAN